MDEITLEFDAVQVSCRRPDRLVESVPWSELRAVLIETNDSGPFGTNVFWILVGETSGCVVSQEAEGSSDLLERLQKLPGFDIQAVVDAMGCVEEKRFLCWERKKAG